MRLRGLGLDFEGSWNRFDASKLKFSRFCGINVSLETSLKNGGPWCLGDFGCPWIDLGAPWDQLWRSWTQIWMLLGSILEVLRSPLEVLGSNWTQLWSPGLDLECTGLDLGCPDIDFGCPGIDFRGLDDRIGGQRQRAKPFR